MRRNSGRSTHALIVAYTSLILVIFLFLLNLRCFGQNGYVVLEYDSVSIIEPNKDTLEFKVNTMFYFNKCSFTMVSQSEKVYNFLIPSWDNFDKYRIRVFEDTGVKLEDNAVIYSDEIHKQMLAVYFATNMNNLRVMRKNNNGIIFH